MCECLEYKDGDMYLCEACGPHYTEMEAELQLLRQIAVALHDMRVWDAQALRKQWETKYCAEEDVEMWESAKATFVYVVWGKYDTGKATEVFGIRIDSIWKLREDAEKRKAEIKENFIAIEKRELLERL